MMITNESTQSDLLSLALAARAAHVCTIPASEDGEKKPDLDTWKAYQDRLPSEQELRAWFHNGRTGLGVVTGAVSGNLEVLDFDNHATFIEFLDRAKAAALSELIARLYQERTPRGAHLLYRCETIAGNQKLALDYTRKALIETRGEGGFCIVAPSTGRVHETGKPYVLEQGSLASISTITPEERADLFHLARSLSEVVEEPKAERCESPAPGSNGDRPGDLFNMRASWNEILEPHGWQRVFTRNNVDYWRRPGKDRGISATTNFSGSDLLYVFSTSTPFASERGYSKFSAYTLLNHGNDFTKAAQAIRDQYKDEKESRERIFLDDAREPSAEQHVKKTLTLTKLSDLLNEPEEDVSWLVENLLPTGGFSLLVAKPKAGKSTLARNLALAVARGDTFLNRVTQRGAVIYLALEEKRSEVKKHFQEMGATGEEEIYIFAASAPVDALQQVRAIAEEKKPVLIIIDPLFRFARVKDGNDYAQVTAALEPLLVLARETGAHVLCVHHAGKSDRDGGDSVLGSTAIFAAVDTALIMKRSERYRTIGSVQRYGEDLPEAVLRFDSATRTVTLGASKEQEEEQRISAAIIEFLEAKQAPVEEWEIQDEVEGRKAAQVKSLRTLLEQEKIFRQRKNPDVNNRRNNPYLYALSLHWFISSQHISGNLGTNEKKADLTPQEDSLFIGSRSSEKTVIGSRDSAAAQEPTTTTKRVSFYKAEDEL